MIKILKKHLNLIIIFFVFFAISFFLVLKVKHNINYTPDWDESLHLWMGLMYNKAIFSYDIKSLTFLFKNSNQLYPPFYHIIIGLWYQISGTKDVTAVLVNIPFILILMLSIYGLGGLLGNKKAGLVAAVLTPLLPVFLTLQERTLIDYTSISMFVLSFYILFKTEGFTNRKYSIFFGLLIFLDLIIKWPFVIPLAPSIFYGILNYVNKKGDRHKILLNIIIALTISLPAISWYLLNYTNMIKILNFFWDPIGVPQAIWKNPSTFTLQNLFLYLFYKPIGPKGVGILVLLFFYISLLLIEYTAGIKYLLSSVLITYLVLTFLNDKSEFYMAYTYPLLMITTTIALFNIESFLLRRLSIVFLVLVVFSNFILSVKKPTFDNQVNSNLFKNRISILPNYDSKFSGQKWPTKFLVDNYINQNTCPLCVLVFADNRFLNTSNIRYYLTLKGSDIYPDAAYLHYNPSADSEFKLDLLNKYDYIITKTGDPGLFANSKVTLFVNNYLNSNRNYKLDKIYAPDNTQVFVYTKRHNE
jgi:4-amino-4-deoxy-L-arabinose transferase-like glycosyltransferase